MHKLLQASNNSCSNVVAGSLNTYSGHETPPSLIGEPHILPTTTARGAGVARRVTRRPAGAVGRVTAISGV